jgi:hypothetical protein
MNMKWMRAIRLIIFEPLATTEL